MIIKLLEEVDQRSQQKEKTICFSQFTSFLNLIEPFLKQRQIAYVRCESNHKSRSCTNGGTPDDGSMKNDKRQEALERIKTSTTVRLILISFKAGSTGKGSSRHLGSVCLTNYRSELDLLQQRDPHGSVVESSVSVRISYLSSHSFLSAVSRIRPLIELTGQSGLTEQIECI